VSLQPASAPARFNLGRALQMSGQVDEAIKAYGEALRLDPTYQRAASGLAESHYMRAFTHDQAGRFVQAAAELRLAVSFRPDWPDALSQLTWVLATSEGLSAADREESVRTGERAREITAGRSAECLDSLSAAYASVGRFADAIKTAEDASRLAARSSPALVAQIDARLRTYRSGRAVVRAPTITRP
jgi:tetratricopeptide (TPR) repeat protein